LILEVTARNFTLAIMLCYCSVGVSSLLSFSQIGKYDTFCLIGAICWELKATLTSNLISLRLKPMYMCQNTWDDMLPDTYMTNTCSREKHLTLHSLIASRIVVCVVIFMMKMLIIMSSAHMIKEAEKLRAGL